MKITKWIDKLDEASEDKPYIKAIVYPAYFIVALSPILGLFLFSYLSDYAESNSMFVFKDILWLLPKIGIIIFFFYAGKTIFTAENGFWKTAGIIFTVAAVLALMSSGNNDGLDCASDEYDPIYGGSGYEDCEVAETKKAESQLLYSAKVFLFIFSAMALGAFEKKKSGTSKG